jgi:hypothetical protein
LTNHEPTSPAEHLTHILGLALTDDKFLAVIECDKPSLTGDHAHFSNLLDVHQSIPMDSPKSGISQAILNCF